MPILYQSDVNLMSIECQSDVNASPILFQSCVNALPIWCQSNVKPFKICQCHANPVPILCRSNAIQELPILINRAPIQCQFSVHPVPIHYQFVNPTPILYNPGLICQSIANTPIRTPHGPCLPTHQTPPSTHLSATNNQNSIFTDWQRIGMH